jgi:hypothetical protein
VQMCEFIGRWSYRGEDLADVKRFGGVADLYKFIADETPLGDEKIGERIRGKTASDVAAAISEGVDAKSKK